MTHWLDNLSLRTKILGALMLVVLIGIISLGWDAFSLASISAASSDIAEETDRLITVQDIQVFLLEEDLDEKSILLTGDTSWLDEHEADKLETDRLIAEAAADATHPDDQQALEEIVTIRQAYEDNWHRVLALWEAGDETGAVDEAYGESDTHIIDINDRIDAVVVRGQDLVDTLFDQAEIQSSTAIIISMIGTVLFLIIGVLVFIAVSRTVASIQLVTQAAAAVEAEKYDQLNLEALLDRRDDVGQLARVFKRMVDEIYAREEKLKAQVDMLNIQIDLVRQDKQVAEIVDSEFFQDLQNRAKNIRSERQKTSQGGENAS